jgi:hypothetical protein
MFLNKVSKKMNGVGPIHTSEIEPTLKKLQESLGINVLDNVLGSVGKKQFSGDIDVALNIESDQIPAFVKQLNQNPLVYNVAKTSVIISKVKIVNYDRSKQTKTKRTGYVQVDFMLGDPKWLKVFYHSPNEIESKYKGIHRNIMIANLAGLVDRKESKDNTLDGRPLEIERWKWSSKEGLVRVLRKPKPRKDGKGYVKNANIDINVSIACKNIEDIVKILKLDTPADLTSYESLRAAIEKNHPKELVDELLFNYTNNKTIQANGLPNDLKTYLTVSEGNTK